MGEEYLERLDCLPEDMKSGSGEWEKSDSWNKTDDYWESSAEDWETSDSWNKTDDKEPTEKDLADLLMSIVNETCPQY